MVSIVQIPFYTVRTFWQAKNAAHPKMSGDFLFLRSHEDFAFSGYFRARLLRGFGDNDACVDFLDFHDFLIHSFF